MSYDPDLQVIDTHYTQKRLNEELFCVRVPYVQSRHPEDIKHFGVRVSGLKEYDKNIKNEWITTMLSITSMLNYYKEFVPMRIVDINDTKIIYDLISEHLHAWKRKLERGINIGDSPIRDLIELDKLANVIYQHAKYQFINEEVSSLLAKAMTTTQTINASNFFKTKELNDFSASVSNNSGVTAINNETVETIERESQAEFFMNRSMGR